MANAAKTSLTIKNFLVHTRNKKSTFCQLLSPLILCLILFGFQAIANSFAKQTEINPSISIATPLKKCISGDSSTCVSLGYVIIV